MKCPRCGKVWEISNRENRANRANGANRADRVGRIVSGAYKCPDCGRMVEGYGQGEADLGEILLDIMRDFGAGVLEDPVRLNALLMDYAPEMAKERKLLVNALREGALTQLRRGMEEAGEDLEIASRRCVNLLVSEMWITEEAARYAVDAIALAMQGWNQNGSVGNDQSCGSDGVGEKQLVKGMAAFAPVVRERDLIAYQSIGYKAFAADSQLTEINIPRNIRKIYPKAFWGCSGLKKVTLTNGTEIIGWGAFDGCMQLEGIHIGESPYYTVMNGLLVEKGSMALVRNINAQSKDIRVADGIRSIRRKAFECTATERLFLPESLEKIEEDGIYLLLELQAIEVDSANRRYKGMDGVLHSYDGRELIRYPQGKKDVAYYLEDDVVRIGRKAFSCAVNLAAVTFTGTLREIGERAFEYCVSMENVMLPRSVISIGERAFQYCENLKSVMLPQGILRIGDCAFLNCPLLETVSVPKSVKEIGNMAFAGCRGLSRVTMQENVAFIGDRAFDNCPKIDVVVRGNAYVEAYCKAHGIRYTTS